jgi:hypothetical protein
VPVKAIFRCQFCDAAPDAPTHTNLVRQLRAELFGEYIDAAPSNWLTWTGHGPFGPVRYACPRHRGQLVSYLRIHYGAIGPHPWKRGPYRRFAPPPARSHGPPVIGPVTGWAR